MSDADKKVLILGSLRKALYPFAKLLIHLGCSYKDFSEVAKLSFLDAAAGHLANSGSVSKARLSEFSGVSTREIASLIKSPHQKVSLNEQRSPAAEVLNQWSTNPSYSQANGMPVTLPIRGGQLSLQGVLNSIDGEYCVDALVDELNASGSIDLIGEDQVRFRRRAQIYAGFSAESIYHFERTIYTMGSTLVSNMTAGPDDSKLLEQASYTYGLRPLSLPKFILLTRSSSESFVELVDEWITANEDGALKANGNFLSGVGVYAFHTVDCPKRFDESEL